MDEAFQRRLLKILGRAGVARVKPKILSSKGKPIRALRRALRPVLLSDNKLVLQIPHYWAVYVHDGRSAPFGPRVKSWLVWFKNPRQDPRLQGGQTPERASQLRRLTKAQWEDVLDMDREARLLGLPSPVVITRQVRKPTRGTFFFGNAPGQGMSGFRKEANRIGAAEFRRHALQLLRKELGLTTFIPFIPADSSIVLPVRRELVKVVF